MKRRYYTANIPSDSYETEEAAFDAAVLDIKDRMKLFFLPATWRLVWIRGDLVRVCLETNN